MGMNVYTMKGIHIGKRHAAGIWCWDCRVRASQDQTAMLWYCHKCSRRLEQKTLADTGYNPALRELGFDKGDPKLHHGIDGASAWTWQIGEHGLGASIDCVKRALKRFRVVRTEYREVWPIKKFWEMFRDVIEEEELDGDFS